MHPWTQAGTPRGLDWKICLQLLREALAKEPCDDSRDLSTSSQKGRNGVRNVDHWARKMQGIYTMEYYSAIAKNRILTSVGRWMEPKVLVLSEGSQYVKHPISLNLGDWGDPGCKTQLSRGNKP